MRKVLTSYKGTFTISDKRFMHTLEECKSKEKLQNVYVEAEKNRIISTDGKKLFLLNADFDNLKEPIETGYYDMKYNSSGFVCFFPISSDEQFPNVDNILPTEYSENEIIEWPKQNPQKSSVWYRLCKIGGDRAYNIDYFDKVFKHLKNYDISVCGQSDKLVFFDNKFNDWLYIVMGLRI